MMKNTMVAGLLAAAFSAAILGTPVEARESGHQTVQINKKAQRHSAKAPRKSHKAVAYSGKRKSHKAVAQNGKPRKVYLASRAQARDKGQVVSLIKTMAPIYGVPTWFALRIAKVESGYNPNARGSAGELGVFQLKCATARGIGFRGNCSGLLDARTNVAYGLRHLSLAVKSSGGNLRLAASKHNGGLGRKTVVYGYVAKIF